MEEGECIVRRGLGKKHASIDYAVWQWKKNLEESRSNQVTKKEIQVYALETYKKAGIDNFKASDGWYRRWRVRWKCSNVIRTKEKKEKLEEDTKTSSVVQNDLNATKLLKKDIPIGFLSKEQNPTRNPIEINDLNNEVDHSSSNATQNSKACHSIKYGCDFPNILRLKRVKPSKSVQLDHVEQVTTKETSGYTDTNKSNNHDSFGPQSNLETNIKKLKKSDPFQSLTDTQSINNFNSESAESNKPVSLSSTLILKSNSPCFEQTKTSSLNVTVRIDASSESNPQCEETIKTNPVTNVKKSRRKELTSGIYLNHNIIDNCSNTEPENVLRLSNEVENEQNLIEIESMGLYSDNSLSLTLNNSNFNSDCNNSTMTSKSMFDRNYLDFGDHELFCESCDDFHPHHKGTHLSTCKQNKNAVDSLLNCVLDKTDTKTVVKPIFINKQFENKMDKSVREKEVNSAEKFIKTNLMLSKGKRYQVEFKTKVLNYALNHSVKEAAHMFKVNRGTVSEWLTDRKRYADSCSTPKPSIVEDNLESGDSEFLSWLQSSKFNLTNDIIKQKTTEWLSIDERTNKSCQWLRMYAHRLHGIKDNLTKKRYITYPDTFKRVVVFYAETHSKIAAARVFSVARRRVLEWQETAENRKKKPAGDKVASNVTDESVDKKVWEWYCNQKSSPSSKQVREKALKMYRSAGYMSIACGAQWYYRWRARHKLPPPRAQQVSDSLLLAWVLTQLDNNRCVTHTLLAEQAAIIFNTKVSRGWTFRFCKKFHKLLLSLPSPATPLFSAMELQVSNFRKLVQDTVAISGSTKIIVVAMDEVPLQFLPKDSGKRPLLLRRPGFESCLASLVVSSISDGALFPTMIIFKGNLPTATMVDPNIVSTMTETGRASEGTMIQWINQVLLKQLGESGGILITDCFDIHTTKEVTKLLAAHNIQHLVIPGGCAFKLLPITKLCQSFQTMLEEMCFSSIVQQTETLRPPSADELYKWSLQVHKHLNKNESTKAAFMEMLFKSS